jgi:hypothetical protein
MVDYCVHSLRDDCSAVVPRRLERVESLLGHVLVLAHQLALEGGLQLGLLLDLAGGGGERWVCFLIPLTAAASARSASLSRPRWRRARWRACSVKYSQHTAERSTTPAVPSTRHMKR